MYSFVLFLHIVICLVLLALILIQRTKAGDIGSSFGAGASTSMFGASGATSFLVKLTTLFGVLFFATSLTLGILSMHYAKQHSVENAVIAAASQVDSSKTANAPVLPTGPTPT